jgi:hypothetical protein
MAGGSLVTLGRHGLIPDMTVIEFLVGVAFCRCGPANSTAIACQISGWLDRKVRVAELRPSLATMTARGWVRLDAGIYTIADNGGEAVKGVYAAVIRLLDRGQRFLDVGVFMSIMKDFERSLDHEDR